MYFCKTRWTSRWNCRFRLAWHATLGDVLFRRITRRECGPNVAFQTTRRHGSITRNARATSRTMKLRYRRQNDHDNTRISRPRPATPALKDKFFVIPAARHVSARFLTTFNLSYYPARVIIISSSFTGFSIEENGDRARQRFLTRWKFPYTNFIARRAIFLNSAEYIEKKLRNTTF